MLACPAHLSQHCQTPGCVIRNLSGTLMKVRMMMYVKKNLLLAGKASPMMVGTCRTSSSSNEDVWMLPRCYQQVCARGKVYASIASTDTSPRRHLGLMVRRGKPQSQQLKLECTLRKLQSDKLCPPNMRDGRYTWTPHCLRQYSLTSYLQRYATFAILDCKT